MTIPAGVMPVLTRLRPAFSTPTSQRCGVLRLAAVWTTGRRTITNVLRTVREKAPGHRSSYPRVFSPRRWSAWALARPLITCLLDHVVPPGPVRLAGDDTVTAHPGPGVFAQGRHRDGVRSPHRDTTYRWGHQGGVVSGRVTLPFAARPWALPVLAALVPSPRVGSWAWHASSDARAPRPAAAGAPDALGSGASLSLRG